MGGNNDIKRPSSVFSFLPFKMYHTAGTITTSAFDLRTYANISVTKTYYVKTAADGGNDLASGADEANALASINVALAKADVDRVMVKAGVYGVLNYPAVNGWGNQTPNRNIEVIGYGGDVISTTAILPSHLSWSAVDSHYEASYASTAVILVFDASILDANGDHSKLVKKTSIAEVDAAAGSWWYDATADVIYVHTADAREPDNDIYCYTGASNGNIDDPVTYYVEGIKFYGSGSAFVGGGASASQKAFFKNCEFKYTINDCFTFTGGGLVILDNFVVAASEKDGIKFNASEGQAANCIMMNGIARGCGKVGVTNANAYSRHGNGNTIGINCEYFGSYAPNVKDINNNTYVWLLGCNSHDAAIEVPNYSIGEAGNNGIMWLDTCISSGLNGAAVDLVAETGTTIYYHNMTPATPTSTGTVLPY